MNDRSAARGNREPLFEPAPDWAGFDEELRRCPDAPEAGTAADFTRFAIDGVRPERVVRPTTVQQVRRIMEVAHARGLAVVPVGFGAHLGLGAGPSRPFLALSLAALDALVDHQPANMTLTAQAGMSLAALQAAAAAGGQWLPVDPPRPAATSLGGLIGANLSGPSRFSQGTVRDLLIGVTVVRADGSVAKSGGRVVKNVAGYDLGKLYCGSLGTLGIIVEASFKLRTSPQARAAVRLTCADVARAQARLERILTAPLEPSFIELVTSVPANGSACALVVGLAGATEDVAGQLAVLRTLVDAGDRLEEWTGDEADAAFAELRDSRAAGEAFLGFKVSVLPTRLSAFIAALEDEATAGALSMAVQAHAGNGIVHVRVERPGPSGTPVPTHAVVERLRAAAVRLGGTLVVEYADPSVKAGLDLWGGGMEGLHLMKRIKQTLDPRGVLSPGRYIDGI